MYVSVYVTAADKAEAERIARMLVEEKLAACVNYFPCRSLYRWQGSIEEEEEYVLVCKTQKALYGQLQKKVRAIHSYDLPAIVAFDITEGEPEYLKWINDETAKERE